jgi:hypothetical protein
MEAGCAARRAARIPTLVMSLRISGSWLRGSKSRQDFNTRDEFENCGSWLRGSKSRQDFNTRDEFEN